MMIDSHSGKSGIFLDRYVQLAHAVHTGPPDENPPPASLTVSELATLWDCSIRSAQETVRRLTTWGLLIWIPIPGRGNRSRVSFKVHPVHIYFNRAERALREGALPEAGFWLTEIIRECPCIPGVYDRLQHVREALGLPTESGLESFPGHLDSL